MGHRALDTKRPGHKSQVGWPLNLVKKCGTLEGALTGPTDTPTLEELVDRNARETLEGGAHDLGALVCLIDLDSRLLVGELPDSSLMRKGRQLKAGELHFVADFAVYPVFHEERRVGVLVMSAPPGRSDFRGMARHLCRLTEAFVADGSKRAHSSRVHNDQLEGANRELREKNRRLGQLVEKLQEADRVKSNFLATVSHELRTPLTSVIGYSEMLLEGIAGTLNEEQSEYVRTVMEKGDQLLQLITGILDISRMESGEMRLLRAPFDFNEITGIVISTVIPQARRKKIEVTLSVPERLGPVYGDRDRIRQVLINLLGNAVKFTPEGGKIRVAAERQPDGLLDISVSDSGIGISEEHQTRIFDPFYQVDNSSTREYGGTGLGLSIVKRLIELHNGKVWLLSAPGKGSTFHFTLPLALESKPPE